MNICFFIGEIISELEFKFVINTKEIYAILMFDLELIDGTKLKVKRIMKLQVTVIKIMKKIILYVLMEE